LHFTTLLSGPEIGKLLISHFPCLMCVLKKTPERDQTNAQVSKDAAALPGITLALTVCEKQIKAGFSRVMQEAAKD